MATPWLDVPPSVPRSVIRKAIAKADPEASASATPTEPINVERNVRVFIEAPLPAPQGFSPSDCGLGHVTRHVRAFLPDVCRPSARSIPEAQGQKFAMELTRHGEALAPWRPRDADEARSPHAPCRGTAGRSHRSSRRVEHRCRSILGGSRR